MQVMNRYELEKRALESKHARAKIIDPLFARMGRKPRGEISSIAKHIELAHDSLTDYDGREDPPALAGVVETMYEAAVARFVELLDQRDADAAERERKKAEAAAK
jgi:hypothetical protein